MSAIHVFIYLFIHLSIYLSSIAVCEQRINCSIFVKKCSQYSSVIALSKSFFIWQKHQPMVLGHYQLRRISATDVATLQVEVNPPLITRFMGPTWDPSGADRTQVGPMLAPWTLLSGTTSSQVIYDTDANWNSFCHWPWDPSERHVVKVTWDADH